MENASKALLMAGGILIALLVIGALLLMVNQIGDYQRAQDSNKKNSQLVEFNLDFERYADDKGIKGADIISLINKVNDYNTKVRKGGTANSVNYDIKMSVTVSGLDKFNAKYAYDKANDTDSLFKTATYTFGANNNNAIKQVLETFKNSASAEQVGIEKLKIVSSVYDSGLSRAQNVENIKEKFLELSIAWDERNPSLDTIKKYRQYSEFKSSKFKVDKSQESNGIVYNNGQIQKMYFEFDE